MSNRALAPYGVDLRRWAFNRSLRHLAPPGFPLVVALCGSGRFAAAIEAAWEAETASGRVVLRPGRGHDGLHLWRVDLCDEVLAVDAARPWCPRCQDWRDYYHYDWPATGGLGYEVCPRGCGRLERRPYLGESALAEVAYAASLGKRVRYLSREVAAMPAGKAG